MKKKIKYNRPHIAEKKIKLNFFFSKLGYNDPFGIIGTVYAQSDGGDVECGCSSTTG